jgi:diguanylate cyclase (GGDEF)-like protein
MYSSGKLRADDAQIRSGLDACQRIGEPIFANNIRLWLAKAQMDQGDVAGALQSLKAHAAELQSTHSSASNSQFQAALAKGSLLTGDLAHASEYARNAIDYANKQVNSKASADAWQVLYQVAKRQGDDTKALAYLEKFAAADKGYLNDTSARALAYQMVNQQVREKKLQVDALSKQNQVLQLKQQIDKKNTEAGKLLLLMLATVLASIGLYAYRTKRSQLKFMNLARRDGLTGIFNRQHFIEASEDILAYAAKSVRDASVIVIDLDHFKDVNDTYGHAAGDRVLKAAVAACQAQLRSLDVFGRLGGEEFGILLPDCVPERAADVAEQMRSAIAELSALDGNSIDFRISASFGISAARWSGYDLRQLLAHADSALYRAKRDGRNRIAIYDDKSDFSENLPSGLLDRRRG